MTPVKRSKSKNKKNNRRKRALKLEEKEKTKKGQVMLAPINQNLQKSQSLLIFSIFKIKSPTLLKNTLVFRMI
jgi:hypothetical protein